MKCTHVWPLLVLSACAAPDHEPDARSSQPPNIVVVFTDDQGWQDVGVYGAKGFETPHLDRLAREGVRFTDFYVAQPVCSASRAALLTGCYPNRIGISGALGPGAKHGLHEDELTLAELCKNEGYATAIFGKWHLGHHAKFNPLNHGFDEFYGIPYSNDMWPYHPENPEAWGDLPTMEGFEIVGYNTDQNDFTSDFTRRACRFIEKNAEHPFFLYLAHPMPHVPLHAASRWRGHSEQGLYGDVISEIDWSVGAILETLEEYSIDDDTLVIYTSDNGPWLSYGNHAGSTGPLREGKGTTFEGGVRVPCMMRWPDRIPAGSVCSEPVMTIDVLPTVAGVIGGELPSHHIDGKDVWRLVTSQAGARSPHEAYYFYYHNNHFEALRSGRWKLHFPHKYRSMIGRDGGEDGIPGKYNYGVKTEVALFDLQEDVSESRNVADYHPEVMERLLELAEAMRADLGDKLTDRKPTGARERGKL